MYALEGKGLRLRLCFLCNNWKGTMVCFNSFSPKAQSAVVYFMYDRDHLKTKTPQVIYKICLKHFSVDLVFN